MSRFMVRAIRGAITVEENSRDAIEEATLLLLMEIIQKNGLETENIISAFFTLTRDLDAGFPASAARKLPGWDSVPMLCAGEVVVKNQLPMCIRVMIHCHTSVTAGEIRHVYLRKAASLRPDLA